MPVTTGMVGQGFYNRNSAPQMAAIEHVLPWLDEAVAVLPLGGAAPIGLADFGCSEGRNSIALMQRLVPALRRRTPRDIMTVHSDLPTNDFSALFRDLRPEGRSVFAAADVSSCAVAGSMFDRLLPRGSVHLAMTFNAIGFLSRKPVDRLPGYILPNGPSRVRGVGEVTAEERAAFADQAREDIRAFLAARAAELVPGGQLLLQVFGADGGLRTCDGIYDVLNDAVLELVAEGRISRATYERYYQPVYFRTLDEITEAVETPDIPFRIERGESYESPVPFNTDFARTGDLAAYARDYTNFFRAFTEAVLRMALADHPEAEALVGEAYARAERLLREAPERYPFRYIALAVRMTRT
ncbi:MAG: hypothetical protein KDK03_16810 [Rhodobacteraceae bacterium]|nr:hypothetical protein [Paracoccaceae bacterium]